MPLLSRAIHGCRGTRHLLSIAAAATLWMGVSTGTAKAVTISVACGSVGIEFELCREGAEAWAKRAGHTIKMISTPNDANERLAMFQQLLAAGSSDIDVFQIDVVWPGVLAPFLANLAPYFPPEALNEYFPALIANNKVENRLVAVPWFADAGLLYYRKDLLEKYGAKVPETWSDMARVAKDIQDKERAAGRQRMWGFVWQGRAYEGLTCNALEWVHSNGGGTIVDETGKITINNPKAAEALTMAASWVNQISPPGVLNYTEEESRGLFQAGDAVFMRNWPYALSLANKPESPIAGKVGVAPLPHAAGPASATLGGSQLAVSKYSRSPEIAADLIKALAGPEEQKRRALASGFNPTITKLYGDPELLEAVPQLGDLRAIFAGSVARPSASAGARYNQVSTEFWNAVHEVLSGRRQAQASLAALSERLQMLIRR
jgi:trehalose/maltose transport system substrate-binding protein